MLYHVNMYGYSYLNTRGGGVRWQREDSRDWSFYKRPFTIYFLGGSGEFRIFHRVPTYHSAKISWKMEKIEPSWGGGWGCSSKLCLCSSDTERGRCIVIVKISKWLHKRIDCPWNKSKIKETEANCSKNVCVYFQRLVESAEKAHEQHEHDKDLSVGFYPVCLEINGIVIIFKIMIMVL